MKNKILLALVVLLVLFSTACSFNDKVLELPTGKYLMKDTPMEEWAWVLLEDDNKFVFNRSLATSYRPMGTYSVDNNELILEANDNEVYRFEIKGNSLIFESGKYAEGIIEIGTVFELTESK